MRVIVKSNLIYSTTLNNGQCSMPLGCTKMCSSVTPLHLFLIQISGSSKYFRKFSIVLETLGKKKKSIWKRNESVSWCNRHLEKLNKNILCVYVNWGFYWSVQNSLEVADFAYARESQDDHPCCCPNRYCMSTNPNNFFN